MSPATAPSVPASVAPRGRPRSAEADRAILDATITVLCADGFAGLTMAGVANLAGVSTATLYRRYRDKGELVVAALEHISPERPVPDTGNLPDDLRALVQGSVDYLHSEGGDVLKGTVGEMTRNPDLAEQIRSQLIDHRRAGQAVVFDRAVERGEIPPIDDPSVVWSLLSGPVFYRYLVTGEPVTDAVQEQLTELLLRALGYQPVTTTDRRSPRPRRR